jgi:lysophospholipase L1-like esterase
VVSDPVDLFVPHLSDLVVSLHLPDDISMSGSPVSYHVRALQTNYLADGNQAAAMDLDAPTTVPSWFYLSAIDVGRDRPVAVIAALGDSITDGDQTQPEPVDQNARYTDFLAEYILRSNDLHPNGYRYATVVNLGISGNQVGSDFLGESAQARLNRDVLTQTGVTHVIVLEGINDIGLPVLLGAPAGASAAQLIAAHQQIAARARVAGLTTIGLTLPPSGASFLPGYGMGAVEEARQGLNAWMRSSGAYDIVVDIDAVLRDRDDATLMRGALSADGLHPNAAGYREMAKAIYIALSDRPNRSR